LCVTWLHGAAGSDGACADCIDMHAGAADSAGARSSDAGAYASAASDVTTPPTTTQQHNGATGSVADDTDVNGVRRRARRAASFADAPTQVLQHIPPQNTSLHVITRSVSDVSGRVLRSSTRAVTYK